jgi:hypothetical protein
MISLPDRGFPGRVKNRGLRTMFAAFSLDLHVTEAPSGAPTDAPRRASTPARYEDS